MHLVIHAGTHKTASTYLQHVLVLNQALLASRGIYTQPDARLTANHGTAWMVLADNYLHLEAHVREAVRLGCRTALLSSEDFETLVFDQSRARLVGEAARRAGATSLEWTFCLRDPGDYFASMMAQLSRLTYADYSGSLVSALRDGRFRATREAGRYPYYWDFCLDYETHLSALVRSTGDQVTVCDFRDSTPFPGHVIFTALRIDPNSLKLPGASSRNPRVQPLEAEANRVRQLATILDDAGMDETAARSLADLSRIPATVQAAAGDALHRRFAPGMERLLATRTVKPQTEVPNAP
jgi:hypothetical protein